MNSRNNRVVARIGSRAELARIHDKREFQPDEKSLSPSFPTEGTNYQISCGGENSKRHLGEKRENKKEGGGGEREGESSAAGYTKGQ